MLAPLLRHIGELSQFAVKVDLLVAVSKCASYHEINLIKTRDLCTRGEAFRAVFVSASQNRES